MKVFLVDDDKIIRMGLRKIIARDGNSFDVIGEASNGLDALVAIEELRPSIVLTDIKMPIMDGIELIQKIKDKGIDCKVIALSGFDEYSFVRKTLKNGAVDYLLKPVNNKELLELLFSTRDKIIEEENNKKHYELNINRSNIILRKQEILKGLDGDSYFNSVEYLGNYNEYSMAVVSKMVITNSIDETYRLIKEKINSLIIDENNLILVQYKENIIVLYKKSDHNRLMYEFNVLCEQDRGLLIKLATDIDESNSFIKGYEICISKILINFYGVERKKEVNLTKGDYLLLDEYLDKLIVDIELLKEDSFIKNFKELYNLFRKNSFSITVFKNTLVRLIDMCRVKIDDFEVVYDGMEDELISIKDTIMWMKNGDAGVKYLLEYFKAIFKKMLQLRDNRGDKVIQMAKDYIKENYHKNISLGDVADHIYLNPNYLSELFKKKVGKNFIDYIVEIRINQSKELLKNPGVKIYEVAEAVGYSEYVSFNRAFKRIVGISPKEYIGLIK